RTRGNCPSNDVHVAVESALPQSMAQNDRRALRRVLRRFKGAAKDGSHSQRSEEVRSHPGNYDVFLMFPQTKPYSTARIRGKVLQGPGLIAPILIVCRRAGSRKAISD